MVSLGQGTRVTLIGAPSKYTSRHIFITLVDFKEVNFPFCTISFGIKAFKIASFTPSKITRLQKKGRKKKKKMVQCSIYTWAPALCIRRRYWC